MTKGARLLRRSKVPWLLLRANILDNVPVSSVIVYEETFRTVVISLRPKDEEEALKKARQSKYRPESRVFSGDFYGI